MSLSKRKLVIILVGLVVVLGAIAVAASRFRGNNQLQAAEKNIPSYFIPSKPASVSTVSADAQQLPVTSREQPSNGVKYIVNQSVMAAVAGYITTMRAQGWTAVGGSTQDKNQTTIRMSDGRQSLIITFAVVSSTQTAITVYQVLAK